mgnify:FL=1
MKSINLFNHELAILWDDGSETIIEYKKLRDFCPCAFCQGETDVFGSRFGGTAPPVSDSIAIIKFQKVGHYGLQFFWSDGHKDGIYTYDLLKTL